MLLLCCFIDFLNLKGGPSNQQIEFSSPPKANLNGLYGLIAQAFKVYDTPLISPTLLPVSSNIVLPK